MRGARKAREMSQVIQGQPESVPPARPGSGPAEVSQATTIAIGVLLLAGSAAIARFRPDLWDQPAVLALNVWAGRSLLLDRAVHALTTRELVQGVVFVSIIWYLWFDTNERDARDRLLRGLIAAVSAGIVSRMIQIAVAIHPRPLHTAGLGFTLPFGVEPDALNRFSSFPSDHGAVFFGLAMVIYHARRWPGALAFAWAAIIDVARVYDGFHYPSDLLGAFGLSLLMLALFDVQWLHRVAASVLDFEQRRRAWFYLLAFGICYQIATLFDDAREIASGSAAILLHGPLTGS
jgi:membrane-associated phospholipid phosphatase